MTSLLKKYVDILASTSFNWGDEETSPQSQSVEQPSQSEDVKILQPPTLIRQDGLYITNTANKAPLKWWNNDYGKDDVYVDENVIVTDMEGSLKNYHYVSCNDESSDDVKRNRGIIRCGDKVVCKTFGYTTEISSLDVERISSILTGFSQSTVYDSEEGATLRLFFTDKWNLSTHRKINAYFSRWGKVSSKSFGEMFMDALQEECENGALKDKFSYTDRSDIFDIYCSTLDTKKTYAFLVRNSRDNRIVCVEPVRPQMFFIGSFDNTTHLLLEGNDSGVPTPQKLHFESVNDMLNYVNCIDYTRKQGVIVYMPNQTQVKILNPQYIDYFNVRGNEPSVKYRYLQVRGYKDTVAMIYDMYPEYIPDFEKYEAVLKTLKEKIWKSYTDRYINGEYVTIPQPEFFIMQECHNWHLSNKKNNKVSYNRVSYTIDNQHPTTLNKLIKPYIFTKKYKNTVE
jgi:hypothetical protein